MATTSLGYHYPAGTDSPSGHTQVQALAADVDASPGIASMTQAQINALTGDLKRAGRQVFNSTTGTTQRSDGAAWFDVAMAHQLAAYAPPALLNGAFDVWQRGTSSKSCPAGSRTLLADRWYVNPTGAAVTQQRASGISGEAGAHLQVTGATSATTVLIGQRVESTIAIGIAGQVTFSARIRNVTGSSITPVLLLGTPSVADDFTTVTNRLTQSLQSCADGAWTTVSATADISGYTNLAAGLQVEIQLPSGALASSGQVIYLTKAKIDMSPAPLPFVRPLVGDELARCQRYYYRHATGSDITLGPAWFFNSTELDLFVNFPVTMRTTPTIDASSGSGYYAADIAGSSFTTTTLSIGRAQPSAAKITSTSSGGTAGQSGVFKTTNTAAYVGFSAEL